MASLVTTTVTGTLTTTDDIILTGTRAVKNTTSGGILTLQGGASWPGGKITLGGGNAAGGDIALFTGLSTETPTQRLYISAAGQANFSGNVALADDKLLKFGTSADLTIQHHNSGYGRLENAGTLYIVAETLSFGTDNSSVVERLNINAAGAATFSGNVGIGVAVNNLSGLHIDAAMSGGNGSDHYQLLIDGNFNIPTTGHGMHTAAGIQINNSTDSGDGFLYSKRGITIAEQTVVNYPSVSQRCINLLIGTVGDYNVPSGNYSIYSASTRASYFAGTVTIGAYTLPNTDGTSGYHLQTDGAGTVTWGAGGGGTVTSVTAGTGMTQTGTSTVNPTLNVIGGTGITANANDIAITNTAVTAGSYTYAAITVDAQGRLTAASSGTAPGGGTVTGSGTDNYIPRWNGTTALHNSIIYDSGASVGISSVAFTSPAGTLHTQAVGANITYFDAYSTTNGTGSQMIFRKSAKATVGKTETGSGDSLGTFSFYGVNSGSGWGLGAAINISQEGTSGASYVPAHIAFATCTSSAYAEHMRIASGGNVGIGITNPANDLQVGSVGASNYSGNHFAFGNGTKVCAFFQSNTFSNIYTNIAYKFWVSGTTALTIDSSRDATFTGDFTNVENLYVNQEAAFDGHAYPYADSSYTLGTSALRWSTIYGDAGNFSGVVTGLSLATSAATGVVATAAGGGWNAAFHSINTNADSAPSYITLEKISASPANGDYIGGIVMKGRTSTGVNRNYVEQWCRATVVTNGSESSRWNCGTYGAGTEYPNTLVCDAGNVGIGTDSPGANLDSDTDTNWSSGWANNLRLTSVYYPCLRFFAQASNKTSLIGNNHDGGLWFGVNGSGDAFSGYAMVIKPDGKVGIGTAAPEQLLHLKGAVPSILFTHTTNGYLGFIGDATDFLPTGGTAADTFGLRSEGAMTFGTNGNNFRAIIATDGKVGIGTTAPISLFDVFFTSSRRLLSNYDDSLITLKASNNSSNPENLRLVADDIIFNTGTSGSGSERMRITDAGKVGIGVIPATDWDSAHEAIQLGLTASLFSGGAATGWTQLMKNGRYVGGGVYKYITTDEASRYNQKNDGTHHFDVAPSGTANAAITFTTALSIINSGNVGIGYDSPECLLDLKKSLDAPLRINLHNQSTNAAADATISFETNGQMDWGMGIDRTDGHFKIGRAHTLGTNTVVQLNGSGTISAPSVFIDAADGNVGIGTIAPLGILSLPGADTTTKPQIRFQTGAAANLADAAISTTDDSGGTNVMIGSNQYWSGGSITRFVTDRSGSAIDFGYAGRMKFYTGEGSAAPTERMRIERDGNVGIGITNPSVGLEVAKTSADASFKVNRTDQTNIQLIAAGSSYVRASAALILQSNGANNRLTLATDGSATFSGALTVGGATYINTASGTTRLKLKGSGSGGASDIDIDVSGGSYGYPLRVYSGSTNKCRITHTGDFIADTGAFVQTGTSTNTFAGAATFAGDVTISKNVPVLKLEDDGGAYTQLYSNNNGSLYIEADKTNAGNDSKISFSVDNSEWVRITADGNVGIGTTAPSNKLTIAGTGSADHLHLYGNGTYGIKFSNNGTNFVSYIRTFEASTQADNYMSFGVSTGNNTTSVEAMRLTGDGYTVKSRTVQALQDGACYKFNGVHQSSGGGDYIQLASDGRNGFSSQHYTVAGWIKLGPSRSSDSVIFSYDHTGHSNPHYAVHVRVGTNGSMFFGWNNGSTYKGLTSSAGDFTDDTWHHFACTYTSGAQKIYADGVQVAAATETGTITFYDQEVYIGRASDTGSWGGGAFFEGSIRAIQYFPSTLSAGDVQKLYSSENPKRNTKVDLLTNGDFSSASGWTVGNWTISGGKAIASDGDGYMTQGSVLNTSKKYLYTIKLDAVSGNLYIYSGTGAPGAGGYYTAFSSPGTYTFIANAYNSTLGLYCPGGTTATVDSIRAEEITTLVDLTPHSGSPTVWYNSAVPQDRGPGDGPIEGAVSGATLSSGATFPFVGGNLAVQDKLSVGDLNVPKTFTGTVDQQIVIPRDQHIAGVNYGGTGTVKLIGTASDRVKISDNGTFTIMGGTTSFGNNWSDYGGTNNVTTMANNKFFAAINNPASANVQLIGLNTHNGVSIAPEGGDTVFGGCVGIGTTNPGTLLEVAGALTINGNITNSADAGYYYLNNAGTGNSGVYIAGFSTDIMRCHVPANKYFEWEVGGTQKLKLDSTGLLTVAGALTGTSATFSGDVRIGGATEASSWHTVSILTGGFIAQYEGTNINRGIFTYASADQLQIGAYDYGSASTGYKELKLVTNSLAVTAAAGATFSGGIAASGALSGTSATFSGTVRVDNTASTVVRLHLNNSSTNDYASIYADTATAYKNLILNQTGGNVGIGITNPSAKLHVNGTATFSGTLKADTSITLKDGSGSNVGALTVLGGNNLTICGSQANHCGLSFATNSILPATAGATNTGTVDLGASSEKFKDFYLSGAANIGGVLTGTTATFTTVTAALVGNATTSTNTTGNAATATTLATGRTIAMTGDVTWTSPSFNGSGNVTAAATIATDAVDIAMLSASGTASNTTFLRGDNQWATPSGGGSGTITGSGTDHYVPRFNGTTALQDSSMIALDTGRVGIGTATPVSHLDIYNSSLSELTISASSSGGGSSALSLIEKAAAVAFGATNAYGFQWKYDGSDNKLHLSSGSGTTVSKRLTVLRDSGHVGIGTTTPSQLLDVNGTTRLRGALYDKNNSYGTSGQVLSTTGSGGVDWVTVSSGGGSGTVTSVASGTGLTGGTITTSGTLSVTGAVAMSFPMGDASGTAVPYNNEILMNGGGSIYVSASPATNGNQITFSDSSSSDYRLKSNISTFNSEAWTKVKSVNLRRFDFDEGLLNPELSTITNKVGFIAHELAEAGIEGAVEGTKDEVDADGNPVYQKVCHSKLVPVMWGALKEAISKIETLETKVQTLENS